MRQIQFTGSNIEITPDLREFTHAKFKKLARHAERITSISIVFSTDNDKLNKIAEANIHLPGNNIYASAVSEDMYKTIDLLIDKLVRQLNKHKNKNIAERKILMR